jgi:hypothetical protein
MSLLPNKTIRVEYSLLGVGAVILQLMGNGDTVTSLWEKARSKASINTYEKFVSGLVLLDTIGAVRLNNGLLFKNENN